MFWLFIIAVVDFLVLGRLLANSNHKKIIRRSQNILNPKASIFLGPILMCSNSYIVLPILTKINLEKEIDIFSLHSLGGYWLIDILTWSMIKEKDANAMLININI